MGEGDITEVEVNLLFFAKSRELVGNKEVTKTVPTSITGADLLSSIITQYPSLSPLKDNLVIAYKEEYIEATQVLTLKQGDEIAIIPPLSGG